MKRARSRGSPREAEPARRSVSDAAADAAVLVRLLLVPAGRADPTELLRLGFVDARALRRARQLPRARALGRALANVHHDLDDQRGGGRGLDGGGARAR